jgi:hypothetical protein
MRIRIELLMVLAVFGWFASPCRAQDVGVETTAQAERAVAQFKTTWSKNKVALAALMTREADEKKSLQRIIELAGHLKMQACTDQEKTANERAVTIKLRGIYTAFETAAKFEEEEYKSRSNQYDESASSSGSSYETRISLYDKVVWSRARIGMMLFLRSVFEDHVQVANLAIDNTCAGRKILSSGRTVPEEIADVLRTETSRREANEASILSQSDTFGHTLDLIMRMP